MGSRYNWQGASPIKQVDVTRNAGGWLQVVIFAPETVDNKLADLPQYLAKHGFITYLDEVDGKHVIKIADFGKKEDPIIDALRSGGFVSGKRSQTDIPDQVAKLSLLATFRRDSLKFGSFFGILGHISMFTLGALTRDKERMTTGVLYGTSTALTAAFGTGVGAIRFSKMVSGAHNFLEKEGIKLPPPAIKTPETVFRERKIFTKIWDTIKTHPIQATNLIALPGNISLALRGQKELRESRLTGGTKGIGALVSGIGAAISSLIAILVPEATPEQVAEYKKKKGVIASLKEGRAIDAIKMMPDAIYMAIARKPLLIQGTLLLIDNAAIAQDAYITTKHYKEGQGKRFEPILKWITAGGWITASASTAVTSKQRDASYTTDAAYSGLYAQTANLILAVPEHAQPQVIKKVSEYYAAEPEVFLQASAIEAGITAKLNALKKNPWMKSVVEVEKEEEALHPNQKNAQYSSPPQTDVSVSAGIDQLQAYANDPANASLKNGSRQPQPTTAGNGVMAPKPSLDSVTANATTPTITFH